MEIPIVNVGNSKGLRLPKKILTRYNLKGSVDFILKEGHIILKAKAQPREGWEKAFKKMHEAGADELLLPEYYEGENLDWWT